MIKEILSLFLISTSIFAFEQNFILHGSKTTPLWSIKVPENQTKPLGVKIKGQPAPKKGTLDSMGNSCDFIPVGHNKILVEVGIKDINTGLYYDRTFIDNVGINEISSEKFLKIIPHNRSMTLDIIKVSWDYTCLYHTTNTKDFDKFHHSYTMYCPWAPVWEDDCISFQLIFQ